MEILRGPAAENLKKLGPDTPPFDLVFIDADKPGNLAYFLEAKRLSRKGAVIVSRSSFLSFFVFLFCLFVCLFVWRDEG